MSKIEKEIKQIKEELKSIKNDLKTYINQNKLTDETSKEYIEALISCGKHTHEVDYDYLGSGTNHLGCELKLEMGEKN
jgi:predicted translin family RNA/ssDNA-binding protein